MLRGQISMPPEERRRFVKEAGDYVISKCKEERLLVLQSEQQHWVTTAEAAKILGITPKYLRSIKDQFPHVKTGSSEQGRLLFLKEALLKCYVNNAG